MEFEEFVAEFGHWYGEGKPTCCLVGIRSDESLNRWRAVASASTTRFEGHKWTTWKLGAVFNAYPIYDWRTRDIWVYNAKTGTPYNRLYDRFYQAGLTIHQMRICQPYGDDQRKGLWLFHLIEPDTWARVLARVNGANQGALYARESGNILGVLKVTRPEGHTWESFAGLILDTLPRKIAEHYREKIDLYIHWHGGRIPDDDVTRKPSWRRVCRTLLRNDYSCRGLVVPQKDGHNESYRRYLKIDRRRRGRWSVYERRMP
jgi:predicted phosphoadenosine phosphosulfate sulfurtransferase